MLRSSFSSAAQGKRLDLGGGDSKDKMMMFGLVGVILVAVVALVWTFMAEGDKGRLADEILVKCAACGYEEHMTKAESAERFEEEIPDEAKRGMNPPRLLCSKCQDKRFTAVIGTTCPKCKKGYVSKKAMTQVKAQLRLPIDPAEAYRGGPIMCPNCGIDVKKWWAENKGRK